MRLIPLLFSTCLTVALADDKLLFAQSVWRHGDRTPTRTYPSDPYQIDFWGAWGELTTIGMKQQFLQGQRLRKMYIEQTNLISPKYKRDEIYVHSADTPRCIQSAQANMAGFYFESPTHPNDTNGWPSNWTPIPVHSLPPELDRVRLSSLLPPGTQPTILSDNYANCYYDMIQLEPGENCDKAAELEVARVIHRTFVAFLAEHMNLFIEIMKNGGETLTVEFETLARIYGAIQIEREYYNLPLPAWITDDIYNELMQAVAQASDFVVGAAGFGQPADDHLIKLRGGFLLNDWVNNLRDAASSSGTKYIAYSGHDSTLVALLHTLDAKFAVLGSANPGYASTVVAELWLKDDGQHYVKFLFSPDANSEFKPFTRSISGCPNDSDFCNLNVFEERCKPFIPKNSDCNLL